MAARTIVKRAALATLIASLVITACAHELISGVVDDLRLSACVGDCNKLMLTCGDDVDRCFNNCAILEGGERDRCESECTQLVFDCFESWAGCSETCLADAEAELLD